MDAVDVEMVFCISTNSVTLDSSWILPLSLPAQSVIMPSEVWLAQSSLIVLDLEEKLFCLLLWEIMIPSWFYILALEVQIRL